MKPYGKNIELALLLVDLINDIGREGSISNEK